MRYKFYGNRIQYDNKSTNHFIFSLKQGFGFVIEENRLLLEELQSPELNSGFEPYYWQKGEKLTHLSPSSNGMTLQNGGHIPLIFKAMVPTPGRYHLTVTITAGDSEIHNLTVSINRRQLIGHLSLLRAGATWVIHTSVNLCPIIPRGKTLPEDVTSIDLSIIADCPVVSELEIHECNVPTLFLMGDSTVTDQGASYPNVPGNNYCGWGQMLRTFLSPDIAVSNHAHSGLTTESFRTEGHYDIIKKHIHPGDFCMFQFGHNDQKLSHLSAKGGYAEQLKQYTNELKELGALPILVSPIARNTWKRNGQYNDLLIDYAQVCEEIAAELGIPFVNLHKKSMDFIQLNGLEQTQRYFFPNDYTHTNDYGGYMMGSLVAMELEKIPFLANHIDHSAFSEEWPPPQTLVIPTPPKDFSIDSTELREVSFTDISASSHKDAIISLTQKGTISNEATIFDCDRALTRIEAMDWLVKTVRFVPTNVYNDHFSDVLGHEWYAGLVEVVWQNDILPPALTVDGLFHPQAPVTEGEFLSFCINSFACRKSLPDIALSDFDLTHFDSQKSWMKRDLTYARALGLTDESMNPDTIITRAVAVGYLFVLAQLL